MGGFVFITFSPDYDSISPIYSNVSNGLRAAHHSGYIAKFNLICNSHADQAFQPIGPHAEIPLRPCTKGSWNIGLSRYGSHSIYSILCVFTPFLRFVAPPVVVKRRSGNFCTPISSHEIPQLL